MVRVDINSKFLEKGEKLRLTIKPEGFPPLAIRLLKPGKKPLEMDFTRGKGKVSATYEDVDRDGLYVFNIRKGQRTFKKWAVVGDLLLDWYPISYLFHHGKGEVLRYLDSFSRVGNVIVLHNLTSWKGVSYPSKVFPVVEDTNPTLLNFFLDEAGKRGCGVLFSYHWVPETDLDMWRYPAEKQIASAKKVIKELYETYYAYDAMAGFYSYWEPGDIGESTYFQQTLDFVKKLDEGLFTASAPYIFSTETYHGGSLPLMPSALSSIKSLDCIVPQSSVAVYPYPLGRTKDHAMLAAGSSAALGKVVLGHIETFGRSFVKGEKDPPVEFIKGQLLSASMTRGTRGASTFIYSYMLDRGESIIKQFDAAVKWQEVTSKFRNLFSPIGVYVPLNASHWPTVLVPFLRKIRRLGMDFSIIQLPLREAGRWAKSIRRDVKVLLLPDPPELSRSEVKFLNGYLREGNSIVVFGYPPRGIRSLLGVESRNVGKYGGVMLLKPIGDRMPINVVRKMGFQLVFCATPMGAEPLAVYESIPSGFQPGAWAITEKRNEGRAFFVGIPSSVVLDKIPGLFLDIVDLGLSGSNFRIPWDIYGLTEDCELIAGQDFILCVNLSEKTVEVLASYRGVTLPQSIEPFSGGIKVEGSDGKIFLRLILRPFEPAGAKLITK